MNSHLKYVLFCTFAVLMVTLSGMADSFTNTPGTPGVNCGVAMKVTISEGSGNGKTSKSDIGCMVKAGNIGLVDPASEGSTLSDVLTFAANPADATKSIATVFSDGESTLPKFTCSATTPCLVETSENTGVTLTYVVTNSTTKSKITYSIITSEGNEVPEPGALWLFGSGLLCFAGIIRRRLL